MVDIEAMTERILEQDILEIAVKNVQSLSHEEYALVRKNYFGASDSSILCGVNLYKNMDALIKEKNTKYLTDEEKAVGEKPIVKKGYDLEPIILAKAEEALLELGYMGILFKPVDMFKFKNVDGLSVNYDGIFVEGNKPMIPVEAKLVSKYGEKYYNKSVSIDHAKVIPTSVEGATLEAHIKRKSVRLGIPPYYYTQCQQEIAGINAPYCFLAALFDETWTFKLFYIPRDEYVIENINSLCIEHITKVDRI